MDRRVLYRDHLLRESMAPLQHELQLIFRLLHQHTTSTSDAHGTLPPLSHDTLRKMKVAWLVLQGLPSSQPSEPNSRSAYFDTVRGFYAALLSSGLLSKDADLRLVLDALRNTDLLEPTASFYEALFVSLWSLSEAQREAVTGSAAEGGNKGDGAEQAAAAPSAAPEIVAGAVRELRRGFVGDLAGAYMGHALAQPTPLSQPQQNAAVRRETWEIFFSTFANAQPAPRLMDLWWGRFLEWVDAQERETSGGATPLKAAQESTTAASSSSTGVALPYQAVHAVLAWCALSRDMERALKYFNAVNKRGVTLHASTSLDPSVPPSLVSQLANAGSLTAKSSNASVQLMQLALLVKLMASTKSVKLDGGLRSLVVRDVQQQVDPEVLYTAPWGVLNDLLSGLSVPSAMQLLRRCSAPRVVANDGAEEDPLEETAVEQKKNSGREIPFYIWASLLRRCCREHLQDQAESLFLFLRHKFRMTAGEKRELIEIMMRMYVTMQPSDFPSAVDVFLQHVLRTPPNEPAVAPDGVLYELLIKSGDSRNASMMLFLEACASGVPLTPELFDSLMGSTQFKTVAALSRKLPHDYAASSFDAQLKIPAEADAHLRREEALRARGKPLYDSTGDAG